MIPNGRRGAQVLPARQRRLGGLWDDITGIFEDLTEGHPLDPQRNADADRFGAAAMAGDRASYLHLKCLSGVATPGESTEFQALTGTSCGTGWATQSAKDYGRQVLAQVDSYLASVGADGGQQGGGPVANGGGVGGALAKYAPALAVASIMGLVILPGLFAKPKRRPVRRR